MEYRLSFFTLAMGSLAVCISILATAWVLDRLGLDRSELERGRPWPAGGGRVAKCMTNEGVVQHPRPRRCFTDRPRPGETSPV